MNSLGFYVAELCRLYVSLLLTVAVIGKARDRRGFETAVTELLHVGPSAGHPIASAVLVTELAIALLLLAAGTWAQLGSIAAILLSGLFTVLLATALAQGRAIACNCFGGTKHLISGYDIVRNAMLMATCGFYLIHAPTSRELDPAIWLLLTGIALIAVIASIKLDDIAELAS